MVWSKEEVIGQWGSLHSSPSVSVYLSLSHQRSFDSKKEYRALYFFKKCYGHSSYCYTIIPVGWLLESSQWCQLLIQQCCESYPSRCCPWRNVSFQICLYIKPSGPSSNAEFYNICLSIRDTFNKFPECFVQAFKIVVDSWKFIAIHVIRWQTNFLWFQVQMNSYSSNWNTPY